MKTRALLVTALFAALGCQNPDEPTSVVAQLSIAGGVPSTAADDGVVQLKTEVGLCTGALVASNLVLTAQQCLVWTSRALVDCSIDGIAGDTNGLILSPLEPSRIEVRIGASPSDSEPPAAFGSRIVQNEQAMTVCQGDIAFLILDRPLVELPMLQLRLVRPTRIGEAMSVVGYGDTVQSRVTHGSSVDSAVAVRRRRDGLKVLDVGGDGSVAETGTFLLGTSICPGDVGSPAISASGAAIVGIASLIGQSPCEESPRNIFTRIDSYREFVVSAFDRAGATPWLEGEPTPMRQAGPESSGCAIAPNNVARTASWSRATTLAMVLSAFASMRLRRLRSMARSASVEQ